MVLQLTGRNERDNLYKDFSGIPLVQMPELVRAGYAPVSVARIMQRREKAPEEVIDT